VNVWSTKNCSYMKEILSNIQCHTFFLIRKWSINLSKPSMTYSLYTTVHYIYGPDSSYPPSYQPTSGHLSAAANSKTLPKNPVMCIVLHLENSASQAG